MEIRLYQPGDEKQIVKLLADAFQEDPLYHAFVHDPAKRRRFLEEFMRFRLRFGVKKGLVFVEKECRGAAILIRPDQQMTPWDLIRLGGLGAMLRSCTGEERKFIMAFNTRMDQERDRIVRQPFWHLSPMAVTPEYQGQGCGTALLQRVTQEVAQSGLPCYLETQTARNIPLYERCGFESRSRVQLPELGLESCSMLFPGTRQN